MTMGMNETQETSIAWLGLFLSLAIPFGYVMFFYNDLNLALAYTSLTFMLFLTLMLAYIPYVGFLAYIGTTYIFIIPTIFNYMHIGWCQETMFIYIVYIAASIIITYYMTVGKTRYEGYL